MSIDPISEPLLSLNQAVKLVPSRGRGRHVALSTLYRWAKRGVNGVRLEVLYFGGTMFTTAAAIGRFAAECSAGRSVTPPQAQPRCERAVEQAVRQLDEAGF